MHTAIQPQPPRSPAGARGRTLAATSCPLGAGSLTVGTGGGSSGQDVACWSCMGPPSLPWR